MCNWRISRWTLIERIEYRCCVVLFLAGPEVTAMICDLAPISSGLCVIYM